MDQLAAAAQVDRAVFFCRIRDRSLLTTIEFYAQDLALLGRMANHVEIVTRYRDLLRARGGLLWCWWHTTALPAVILWRLFGSTVVVTGAVDLSNQFEPALRHRVKRVLTGWSARLAHLNVAISHFEAHDLGQLQPKATVIVLEPGVDCNFYRPSERSSHPTIVTVGQMNQLSIHRKGIDRAFDVFDIVLRRMPDVELIVVGPISDEGRAWLARRSAAEPLERVRVTGWVDRQEKRDILSSAWVYVQPSRYEGFGLAVAEAMACGAVPVVSDAGSLPEVVGGAGVVVEYSLEAFAESVLGVLEEGANAMVRRARAAERAAQLAASTRRERLMVSLASLCTESRR